MRETRRVSRPLIFENPDGVNPLRDQDHALLSGVGTPPPIRGYVMTTLKESPLAQSLFVAPGPQAEVNPLLAVWQYGLGRTAVLTTDTGQRWATDWSTWSGSANLYAQLLRWLMRPAGDNGKLTVNAMLRDGEVQIVVDALDADDDFLNFLQPVASVLDPQMQPIPLALRQTAPGRYVGSFVPQTSGSFLIHVSMDDASRPITTAVMVSASREYQARATNVALMNRLVSPHDRDTPAGIVVDMQQNFDGDSDSLPLDPFRDGLSAIRATRDVWPLLVVFGCCLFLADVTVRRIAIRFEGLAMFQLLRSSQLESTTGDSSRIARLDALRQAKRDAIKPPPLTQPAPTPASQPAPSGSGSSTGEELSYGERLLRAKRNATS